jgi:sterol desaturase/sphingolipid hydroxylase (fatty acid hydroxylase superfamily)
VTLGSQATLGFVLGCLMKECYAMNRSHWPYFKPFFLYFPGGAALLAWAGFSASFSWISGALMFALGLVGWTLIEYGAHRGVFHFPAKSAWVRSFLYRTHLAHHDDPQDIQLIFIRFSASVPISALLFLLLWGMLGQWQRVAFALTGLWAGYLFYEFVHYSAHFRTPKTALMRYLKKYHTLHHHQDEQTRFGVTTPLVDWLFGTYRSISAILPRESW